MRHLTLALAAALGLFAVNTAEADNIVLNFAADTNSDMTFVGSGTAPNRSSSWSLGAGDSGANFVITSVFNGTGDGVGLFGNITGSYTFNESDIVISSGMQTAALSGSGQLQIFDTGASGNALTGDIVGIDITTMGTGGDINAAGGINLTNVTYSGANADLTQFAAEANSSGLDLGIVTLTFQFIPGKSLTDLLTGTNETSYSGTLTAVPEPASLAMVGVGLLGVPGLVLLQRRRAKA